MDETRLQTDSYSSWYAQRAWLGGGALARDVLIEARKGRIISISPGSTRADATPLHGVVIPGLVNAHSHAFHRLLRGQTHRAGGDFWIWRDRMYQVAGSLTPESYERLATAVFVEMAMAGVTIVGEFHYLHHQPRGIPYFDSNEMGHAVIRAARTAGINIALLDAGYFRAGFDDGDLNPVQTRFRDRSPETWLDRVESLRAYYGGHDDVIVGVAPHSVRAVPEAALAQVTHRHGEGTPIHIHVSEQPAENAECQEATGRTPTGLLADVGLLGPDTTLVHATHLTDGDITAIGSSGSRVCYCATTERDLADGIGPADELSAAGATLCAGSDSHAVIDMFEEARGIEMHTRLATGRRGNFAPRELMSSLTVNGSASLAFPSGGLQVGSPADFAVIDTDSPRLSGIQDATALDSIVFAATPADVAEVFVRGERIVSNGEHLAWPEARTTLQEFARGQ
ncbi:MAG: formimidoylglutamate deiminase [Actinomycetota bacterium]